MGNICLKAGDRAYRMIKDGGFDFDKITTFVAPANGPRWLIASGFDISLIKEEVLGRTHPVLLSGASAGAMRFAAWVQPNPVSIYEKLIESYIAMTFKRRDSGKNICDIISSTISDYVEEDAIPFALANKRYRLAIITARARHFGSFDLSVIHKTFLAAGFIMNFINRSSLNLFFRRSVFHSAPIPPNFCLRNDFKGDTYRLNEANFKHALLASAAVPVAVSGVRNIYGAENGTYRDGALVDYHFNQRYDAGEDEVTLLFTHQERVVPVWFDKHLPYRRVQKDRLENVLVVYPSEEFIKSLPEGRIPERKDFKTYVNNPQERMKNWHEAVERSRHLGDIFIEAVNSGRIREMVEPL